MTAEKIKRKLKNVRALKLRMFELQQRINELEEDIAGLTAVDYSKNKIKSSSRNYIEERYVKRADRLRSLQEEYDSIFKELCDLEDELGKRMKALNPGEYEVIRRRFLTGLIPVSIGKVANALGYTYESVQKIQQRAFKKMAEFT